MGRPIPAKQSPNKPRTAPKRVKKIGGPKKKSRGKGRKNEPRNLLRDGLLLLLEWSGLLVIGLAALVLLLGHFGNRFSGTDMLGSLLPFAGGVLAFVIAATVLLSGWKWLRGWLKNWSTVLPAAVIVVCTLVFIVCIPRGSFTKAFGYYRTLVGGKEEASRITLAHQVYAAYRRLGTGPVQQMIDRSQPFAADIEAAAKRYTLDPDLLKGLAAAESSYLPRQSEDGGQGSSRLPGRPDRPRPKWIACLAKTNAISPLPAITPFWGRRPCATISTR